MNTDSEKQERSFFCSCKYFERNGIPCHHQLAVLKTLPNYEAPSHHDVSVVWWTHYIYHSEPKNACYYNKKAGRDKDERGNNFSAQVVSSSEVDGIISETRLLVALR